MTVVIGLHHGAPEHTSIADGIGVKCSTKPHLGLIMTICLPSLSSAGIRNCFPVASAAILSQVISWGLYVLRLLNKCELAQESRQCAARPLHDPQPTERVHVMNDVLVAPKSLGGSLSVFPVTELKPTIPVCAAASWQHLRGPIAAQLSTS